MLDPQSSRFWKAAVLSGLMDVEALTRCWNAIPPAKRDAPEHLDRRLARQAVQSRALTLWQAQQLLAGRTNGFQVDRYVLLEMIGQGGMGRVYLARDTRLNRRVALKILAPERMNNPRAVARFHREARVGAQLQHENLVRVYDFGESQGRYFLVMEYIEGRTIGHLIAEQGPIPPATAARLARQVALGLSHAHSKGLIHRDVNPYNILVTHDETAKVADLGLAIDLTEEARVTRDGATVGTFDYVAPEQARHSHAADIRSDIYSLGCTLYHMLCGHVPFPCPSLPEKLFSHQALEATPLETIVPGLPAGLADVVRTMMRKSPEERYATPMQVAQALEPYLDENAGAGLSADGTQRPPPERGTAPARTPVTQPTPSGESAIPMAVTARFEENGRNAAAQPETEPVTAAVSAQAIPVIGTLRTGAATEAISQSAPDTETTDPALSLFTPGDDIAEAGTPGALLIDLGPEPPLSDRLARSKSRSPTPTTPAPLQDPQLDRNDAQSSGTVPALPLPWWSLLRSPRGLAGLAAAALLLVVVILVLAFGLRRSPGPPTKPDHPTGAPSAARSEPESNSRSPAQKPRAKFIVRWGKPGAEESSSQIAESLKDAIQTAQRNQGYVELRNTEPLHLDAGQYLDLGSGIPETVEIRAAEGIVPVLDVEIGADRPFLRTGSRVSLMLTGLEIRVHPIAKAGGAQSVPPMLIDAAGRLTVRRCAFRVVDGAPPEGCLALEFKSDQLIVEGCWFEGFDSAIVVRSYAHTIATIRQTMIVAAHPPAAAPAPGNDWRGWGIDLHLEPGAQGKGDSRRLVLDHCTFEGAGFLALNQENVQSRLDVVVNHCAVRAEALLAWRPTNPTDRLAAQFPWKGEGNRYAILGRSWIVQSLRGTPAFSAEVTDLDSWSKFAGGESQAIPTELRYQPNPGFRPDAMRPRDFAFDAPNPPGADPEQVGPWGP